MSAPDSRAPSDDVAPIHRVPATRIVTVEHPSIVRNFEKGLKSLGGEAQLKHVSSKYRPTSRRDI